MAFERQIYASGHRGAMQEASGRPRDHGTSLSLNATLQSLGVDISRILHNAGNAAFTTLLALQLLLEPETKLPTPRMKAPNGLAAMQRGTNRSPSVPPAIAFMPSTPVLFPPMGRAVTPSFPQSRSGGLGPEGFQGYDPAAVPLPRPSFLLGQRSVSDHRMSSIAPNVALATGGRLPGRARVSSMNDLAGEVAVNEMGQTFKSMHVRSGTMDSRTSTPQQ